MLLKSASINSRVNPSQAPGTPPLIVRHTPGTPRHYHHSSARASLRVVASPAALQLPLLLSFHSLSAEPLRQNFSHTSPDDTSHLRDSSTCDCPWLRRLQVCRLLNASAVLIWPCIAPLPSTPTFSLRRYLRCHPFESRPTRAAR